MANYTNHSSPESQRLARPTELAGNIAQSHEPEDRAALARASLQAAMSKLSPADHSFSRTNVERIAELATNFALGLITLPEQGEQ